MSSILIVDGEVVTASERYVADVRIDNGVISVVGKEVARVADTILDASGCYVIPGGVDVHTHLESPSGDFTTRTSDDFYSGTVAALAGGTTTIMDFVKRSPGRSIYDSYVSRLELASSKAVCDFGLHPVVPPAAETDGSFDQLRELAQYGALSWKFFLSYPSMEVSETTLLSGLRICAEEGVLPMVHAETGAIVESETARLVAAGQVAECFHYSAHPEAAEWDATVRAIAFAQVADSAIYIVHVSSRLAAAEIQAARSRGRAVWAETCPQYLLLAHEDYAGLGFDAARYICSPPIRDEQNRRALWDYVLDGSLSVVATDHAPYMLAQPNDLPPQKARGRGDFALVPNGVPGVETRLMLLYESGVVGDQMGMCQFVDCVSTSPAKLFGLYPKKGALCPGSDGDVVVWDPAQRTVIRAATQRMRVDYTLYEGMAISGGPKWVVARGEVVVREGTVSAAAGRGRDVNVDRQPARGWWARR